MFQAKRSPNTKRLLFLCWLSTHEVVVLEAKDLVPPHEILLDEGQQPVFQPLVLMADNVALGMPAAF